MCSRLCDTCLNLDFTKDGEIFMCGQSEILLWDSVKLCVYYCDEKCVYCYDKKCFEDLI